MSVYQLQNESKSKAGGGRSAPPLTLLFSPNGQEFNHFPRGMRKVDMESQIQASSAYSTREEFLNEPRRETKRKIKEFVL